MKLALFTLLFGISALFASNANSQTERVNINASGRQAREVIRQIEEQTDYLFVYNHEHVDLSRTTSLQASNIPVAEILTQLFENSDVIYAMEGNNILLMKRSERNGKTQDNRKVTGLVRDTYGEPLMGVSVAVRGTTSGTITDIDGNYSLELPDENSILTFSFIGFNTKEERVGNRQRIDITLEENIQALEEVVVVGYGTQKKVNLTGSVSSVVFDQEMDNRPITNASQALSGKVTGLWVSQNSGKPGEDGAQLRVRGWGTIGNNTDPLVIIDGVEGAFNQINPNDIESITILKDAASAAIYGSKAANGVVLITTKMGSSNEKFQVNLNSYMGVQSLGRRYNLITNSAENMELINQALVNDGSSPLFPDDMVSAFRQGGDKYKYPNTDWFKEVYKTAIMHEHNLSIRGGTQKSTSFLSFNYLGHDGMMPNTKSERYSIRANLDYYMNSWLKVGGRLNYMRRTETEPYSLDRVFEIMRGPSSFTAPYTRDGRFGSAEAIDENGVQLYDNRNPLIDAANGQHKRTSDFITVNAFADITFMPDLILRTTLSSSGKWVLSDKYNENVYGYTDSGLETTTKNLNREGLDMSREQGSTTQNTMHSTLNYNKKIRTHHTIGVTAGIQLEDFNYKRVYARRSDAPKQGLTQVDAGTGGIQGEGNMEGLRMFSYFGRLNYSFADKYLLEANFRADASSRFKKENRWGYFPGFSAGWRIAEEGFMKDLDIFSNLKLRASWGQLGNQNIEGYWPYLTVINQSNELSYNYGGSFAPGAAVKDLVDEDITWETTTTLDIGVDVGLLDNRLTIEADYFRKVTSDILVQLPIPLMLGDVTAPYENVGKMLNRGIELGINYDNQVTSKDRLGYSVGVNLTHLHNEITKFQGGNSPDQLYLLREGYSFKTLYGYKAVGIYQTDEEAAAHMHSNSYVPKAGNLKFEDVNGDGRLGYEDKQEIGNTIPKFTYGITANLRYKNFDLSLLFQGVANFNVYTQNDYTRMSYEYLTITDKWKNAWSPENAGSKIPSLKFDNSWDQSESSFWVHRGDFLKLKNLQLGYLLPDHLVSRLKMEKIYVYANAQNVFTMMMFKGYEGLDPERNTFDDGAWYYATPRIFSFGINLNF